MPMNDLYNYTTGYVWIPATRFNQKSRVHVDKSFKKICKLLTTATGF